MDYSGAPFPYGQFYEGSVGQFPYGDEDVFFGDTLNYSDYYWGETSLPPNSGDPFWGDTRYPPMMGPISGGFGMDSDGNHVYPGFDAYGQMNDPETMAHDNHRAYMADTLATALFGPRGTWDQQGVQGPYGYMGGQFGFNPDQEDYWMRNPNFYSHGGYGRMRHFGGDTAGDAYARLAEMVDRNGQHLENMRDMLGMDDYDR